MKYKVGDKVRIKEGAVEMGCPHIPSMKCYEGKSGSVQDVHQDTRTASVAVDSKLLPLWWRFDALEPIYSSDKPTWRIIIEGDENTSRAKYIIGKKVIKEVSAKRYHKDKHDPAMAARALIGKMFPDAESAEPEPPKYFTGRVVCVERPNGVWLTVGKIYKVTDGVMECDEKYVEIEKLTSVENLNSRCKKGVKFIEIKE